MEDVDVNDSHEREVNTRESNIWMKIKRSGRTVCSGREGPVNILN